MESDCPHKVAGTSDGAFIAGYCPRCLLGMALDRDSLDRGETDEADIHTESLLSSLGPISFTPGTILSGRFRLISLIGRGGMGEVYRADDLRIGQTVALKFLPAEISGNPAALQRLSSEVRLGRQVAHPNVCRLYDLAEADGQHFIVMELIDGEDLASLLQRIGRVPGRRAMEFARDICAGLAACHDREVIHGDLKPGNVIIDGRGRAQIMDFGLSTVIGTRPEDRVIAGTLAYMAPEQLYGTGPSARADIYALGLVLYEMFTGHRVHDVRTIDELRLALETDPVPPSTMTRIPRPVEDLILRCLDRRPARRPRSAAEVATLFPERDPIEIAIATGEVPSAKTVAAAAETGVLSLGTGWLVLIATVLSMILIFAGAEPFSAVGRANLRHSPDTLAQRARDVVNSVVIQAPRGDEAYGFTTRNKVRSRIDPPSSSLAFFYRQSPRRLAPIVSLRRISPVDPPRDLPGMTLVGLDPEGRLRFVQALPFRTPSGGSEPRWEELFKHAALDATQFVPSTSGWVPPVPYDIKQEWTGTSTGSETVRAAQFDGRVVYFDVIDDASGRLARVPPEQDRWTWIAQRTYLTFLLVSFVAAAVLARRNIKKRWSDLRGARRIAIWVLACQLLYWLFTTDYLALSDIDTQVIVHGVGQAFFDAAQVWLAYVALEPFVRRRWPRLTIGWNRLIEGRLVDPMVGRDVLMGSLFGMLLVLVEQVRGWSNVRLGLPVPQPLPLTLEMLSGEPEGIGAIFYAQSRSITYAFLGLFLFLLLRAMVTRPAIAGTLWILVAALTWSRAEQLGTMLPITLTIAVVHAVLCLLALVRYGLLASVVMFFVYLILVITPLTYDLRSWVASGSVAPILVLIILILFSFRVSLARQPLFGRRILEA